MGLLVDFTEAATSLWVTLYFMIFDKDWINIQYYGLTITVIGFFSVLLFISESPRYLLDTNRNRKALDALKWNAKFNSSLMNLQDYIDINKIQFSDSKKGQKTSD